jgi:hypothetical protein
VFLFVNLYSLLIYIEHNGDEPPKDTIHASRHHRRVYQTANRMMFSADGVLDFSPHTPAFPYQLSFHKHSVSIFHQELLE